MNQHKHSVPVRTLQSGILAYYDAYSGLIPCQVMSVGQQFANIRITANKGNYRKGEEITVSKLRTVPRDCVIARKGCSTRIISYEIIKDA